jgi:sulfite reductase beta subunit-like hemoprotein
MDNNEPIASENNQYPGDERILGVYPQRQQGLFMQRVKIFGGRINWQQWRKVAELARRYSRRKTFHVTTRQDIELHDIAGPHLQAIQQELAVVGLVTHCACGDCVRNITVCPGCTYDPGSGGAFSAAKLVYEHLAGYPCDLPRKFKICFSGCQLLCAKPWISDLGFVLNRNGRFTVIGAGSLGPKPGAGISLFEDIAPKDVLPLCLATLRFFKDCGDRENRSKARLRHLREKLGDEEFKSQLMERFERLRSLQQWPEVPLDVPRLNLKLLWRLQLPNGNIGLDEALQLADEAEPKKAELRINLEHGIELFGSKIFSLPGNLALLENLPVIIACPGLSSCSRALTDTWSLAEAIRKHLPNLSKTQLRINISGCPNSCAHSAAANIGLIGMRRKRDEQSVDCYRLFTGGNNGIDNRMAQAGDVIFAEDVPAAVERLLSSTKPTQTG